MLHITIWAHFSTKLYFLFSLVNISPKMSSSMHKFYEMSVVTLRIRPNRKVWITLHYLKKLMSIKKLYSELSYPSKTFDT